MFDTAESGSQHTCTDRREALWTFLLPLEDAVIDRSHPNKLLVERVAGVDNPLALAPRKK